MPSIPGFSVHSAIFRPDEIRDVLLEFDRSGLARSKAGIRHVLGLPGVRAVAADARMVQLATAVLGGSAVPFRATFFEKTQTSNWLVVWHQDTALPLRSRISDAAWGPWSEKAGRLYAHAPAWALEKVVALRVHLDDSTPTNGPLRVLPGTHHLGVLTDEEIERFGREVAPVDCVAPAGGVVMMRPLTIHASSKSTDGCPRRVLHIEYAEAETLAPGIELAMG